MVRIMFDNGSQRSYITSNPASALSLSGEHLETMMIKTFGSQTELKQVCGVVTLGLMLKDSCSQKLLFLSVPLICEPLTNQPIACVRERYGHLTGLDHASGDDTLDVELCLDCHGSTMVTPDNLVCHQPPVIVWPNKDVYMKSPYRGRTHILHCQTTTIYHWRSLLGYSNASDRTLRYWNSMTWWFVNNWQRNSRVSEESSIDKGTDTLSATSCRSLRR